MFEIFLTSILFQVITVNSTNPCFLNYTAGADMWKNCHMDSDFLTTALMPWQWVTGGWFSMILVSVFVIMTYIKYQKAVYPMIIGIMFLPISYFAFPSQFINWAFIMMACGVALLIAYIFVSQTNES